jgi:hypothetical protein
MHVWKQCGQQNICIYEVYNLRMEVITEEKTPWFTQWNSRKYTDSTENPKDLKKIYDLWQSYRAKEEITQ